MPHTVSVEVLAPLFHRMADEEPSVSEESIPFRTLTVDELKKSIREEVTWLLNTRYSRLPFSIHVFKGHQQMKRDKSAYGLIDFSHFDVSQPSGQRKLERHIKTAIEYYEPRLSDIAVTVKSFNSKSQSANVIIAGNIKAVPVAERYTFPVEIQQTV